MKKLVFAFLLLLAAYGFFLFARETVCDNAWHNRFNESSSSVVLSCFDIGWERPYGW